MAVNPKPHTSRRVPAPGLTAATAPPMLLGMVPLVVLAMILAMALSGCVDRSSSLKPGQETTLDARTFSFEDDYPADNNIFPEYRIVPGDLLDVLFQVRTWESNRTFEIAVDHTVSVKFVNLPHLNETQNVQPDGRISLPYIGEIQVAGMSVDDLTKELRTRYAKVLRDPELYVTVPEFSTQIKELKKDLHTASRGLSRLVTVRPDGFATFPLLGDVFVAGRTIPEANSVLDKGYDSYLPGLHVDLFLEKTTGSVVYVVGRVGSPGAFRMDRPLTTIQALALAGGQTSDSRLDSVIVFRRKAKKFVATRLDLSSTLATMDGSSLFYLRPDDIVYVPRTYIASLAELMTNLGDIFLFKGWSMSGEMWGDYLFEMQYRK